MFDRFVSGSKPSWKRRAVLVASLAAHGLLGLGLLVAGLFHVTEISPPALAIVFMRAHELPAEMTDKQPQRRQHQRQPRGHRDPHRGPDQGAPMRRGDVRSITRSHYVRLRRRRPKGRCHRSRRERRQGDAVPPCRIQSRARAPVLE